MQINRLLEIVYILLSRNSVTAKELAQRFEVSTRTIYRDIETLSAASIPVYMSKGKGGGISLVDSFVLNKSYLTENEQTEILSALQGIKTLTSPEGDSALNKLGAIFNKNAANWIDIDFSYWGSGADEKNKFNIIKNAILTQKIIAFSYFAPGKEKALRTVEPLQIFFKEKAWYLKCFCIDKNDYRHFKIVRMSDIIVTEKAFKRALPEDNENDFTCTFFDVKRVVLQFSQKAWGRVIDEFGEVTILEKNEEYLTAECFFPEDDWMFSYIISYGADVKIIEPESVKNMVTEKLKKLLSYHENN